MLSMLPEGAQMPKPGLNLDSLNLSELAFLPDQQMSYTRQGNRPLLVRLSIQKCQQP